MAGEGDIMNHETALSKAKDIADRILAPAAAQRDKEGKFSAESVAGLGEAGLLGLMLPAELASMPNSNSMAKLSDSRPAIQLHS